MGDSRYFYIDLITVCRQVISGYNAISFSHARLMMMMTRSMSHVCRE
ncbi:uncharacterized protein J3R85_003612 [Psidium guajava]|nr:uncharacterized protein J3R85_003612 [Psidium guajava]